jgi:hypothetical protein
MSSRYLPARVVAVVPLPEPNGVIENAVFFQCLGSHQSYFALCVDILHRVPQYVQAHIPGDGRMSVDPCFVETGRSADVVDQILQPFDHKRLDVGLGSQSYDLYPFHHSSVTILKHTLCQNRFPRIFVVLQYEDKITVKYDGKLLAHLSVFVYTIVYDSGGKERRR